MRALLASHLLAMLESDKQYHDFVKLSPYKKDGVEISRVLFLDGDYVAAMNVISEPSIQSLRLCMVEES